MDKHDDFPARRAYILHRATCGGINRDAAQHKKFPLIAYFLLSEYASEGKMVQFIGGFSPLLDEKGKIKATRRAGLISHYSLLSIPLL
jgi:hypothetical protein